MANGNKIITRTSAKIMIRNGELVRIFNNEEIAQWHNLIRKIEKFQESELERNESNKL